MEIYETIKKKALHVLDMRSSLKYTAKWREGKKNQYSVHIEPNFMQNGVK